MSGKDEPGPAGKDFTSQLAGPRRGIVREFGHFLMKTKKWWLIPLVTAALFLGLLIYAGGSGAAPFLYTFF